MFCITEFANHSCHTCTSYTAFCGNDADMHTCYASHTNNIFGGDYNLSLTAQFFLESHLHVPFLSTIEPVASTLPIYLCIRTALFWIITQQVVLISSRRFGKTYLSHLQGSRIKKKKTLPIWILDPWTTTREIIQNSAILTHTATEAWNHVYLYIVFLCRTGAAKNLYRNLWQHFL